jgi:hypothetical protein
MQHIYDTLLRAKVRESIRKLRACRCCASYPSGLSARVSSWPSTHFENTFNCRTPEDKHPARRYLLAYLTHGCVQVQSIKVALLSQGARRWQFSTCHWGGMVPGATPMRRYARVIYTDMCHWYSSSMYTIYCKWFKVHGIEPYNTGVELDFFMKP